MEDRFRFRVLNTVYNHLYRDLLCLDEDIIIGILENNPDFKEFKLIQCTGLKDKNGKLIFDKDILEQPNGIRDVVEWSDGCYIHNGTAITNYDSRYQGDKWAKEVNTHKILGNIYENPKLLESEE